MPIAMAMPPRCGAGSAVSSPASMRASARPGGPALWQAICAPISMSMHARAAPASTACSSAATRAGRARRLQCTRRRLLFARQHRYQPHHHLPRLCRQGERALSRQCRAGVRRGRLWHGVRQCRGRTACRAGLRARARWFVPRERRRCGAVGCKRQREHRLFLPRRARGHLRAAGQWHGAWSRAACCSGSTPSAM